MARNKKKSADTSEFVLFDIVYTDGTRSSHRRVPSAELGGLDGDLNAKAIIEAQDEKVAALSGRARREIKSITRSS
jgi:hypothetical protein